MALFDSFFKSTSKEIDILRHDVAIFKNLIKERQHPLDLVRELLSNAGARQVGATRIDISYTKDKEGHVFEVADNGCGMDLSADGGQVGRLARFLGLGLSAIVGEKADEFSWKGLGSKLAYQSRRVVIETRAKDQPLYEVRINEPWATLSRNSIPRPRITEHHDPDCPTGTRIKVIGHPPHRQEAPFSLDEVRRFLLHRTFLGFTRSRENRPQVTLSVLGQTERLDFGFPEWNGVELPESLRLDDARNTLFVNMSLFRPPAMAVRLKGFLTWEPAQFGLADENLNTGLLLSSRGIPYFELQMGEFGAGRIAATSPGKARACLVAECDDVYPEMNLSRSALVDSETTLEFKNVLRQIFERLQSADEYARFRQLRQDSRHAARAAILAEDQRQIESDDQRWAVLVRDGSTPLVLMREPRNETEVVAIIGKLESLGALPFGKFQTVAHPGASCGPNLFVRFQEDKAGGAPAVAVFEAGHCFSPRNRTPARPDPRANVICWDLSGKAACVRLNQTDKPYKFTLDADDRQVPVYVMKLMDGLRVLSTRELRQRGVDV